MYRHAGVASITLGRSLSLSLFLSGIHTLPLSLCALHVFVFACRKFVILPVSGTKLALVFVHASLCVGDCGRERYMGGIWAYYEICSALSHSYSVFLSRSLLLSLALRGICR